MARNGKGGRGEGSGGSGIAARLVERAVENPAASGGLLVMALTAGAIVVNATYLQPNDFPRPHLAPRSPSGSATPASVPTPRPREGGSVQATALPTPVVPLGAGNLAQPSVKPAAPVVVSVPIKLTPEAEAAMITDVQRELAKRNLYLGAIDGIAGAKTRAAIATYQTTAGLPATGLPTPELLTQLRQPQAGRLPATAAILPAKAGPVPPGTLPGAPAKPAQITSVIAEVNAADAESYRRIQIALNQIGYGVIPVDGKAGKETSDAIRRFELDYGLPVTGQPSEAVIKRLAAIGALAAR